MGCVCFQQLLAHGLQHIVPPGNIQASRQQISGPAATAFDCGTPIQQPRACMLWMWFQICYGVSVDQKKSCGQMRTTGSNQGGAPGVAGKPTQAW